ncbi:MAG TPA: 1-(5-phosphoribosyl)-5-[(5-phosphoribosylamino)methylideneamino]imidazole-4-carboxamide isomerase [Pirellulaceae bacterium]|nr:1-(5-phosphoribosyl)-5-[(5-phosphoribosylamino)methylideneamino]imidazole-4-carboxamide isomerase [Pirellulaceae bacterium]
MQIWPAIDLRGGKCVRLKQGDYQQETVFGDDPAEMARQFVSQGARLLHLVDLDGARDGFAVNREAVRSILRAVDIPCELGGGIRDEETIQMLLDLGMHRLVIGTKALKEPEWFARMAERFPGRLAVGIDAKQGMVATDGWLEVSHTKATDLARKLDTLPLAAIIYTDIAKDGMMAGPNFAEMREMKAAVSHAVIASGGVTTAADVAELAKLQLDGCIIGRTLYEGKLTIQEALDAAAA